MQAFPYRRPKAEDVQWTCGPTYSDRLLRQPPERRSTHPVMASKTMESKFSPRPRLIIQRVGERRKTTYIKGPPFINEEGLILIDRRSKAERRRKPGGSGEICALLRQPPSH